MIQLVLRFLIPIIGAGVLLTLLVLYLPKLIRWVLSGATEETIASKEDEIKAAERLHELGDRARNATANVAGDTPIGEQVAQDCSDAETVAKAGRYAKDQLDNI